MLIGELAAKTGLSRHTIRYYEKLGLFPLPFVRDNGYKEYGAETAMRLAALGVLKGLGFTLREIRDYLALAEQKKVPCRDVGPTVRQKLEEIQRKISMLEEQRAAMETFFKPCKENAESDCCTPIAELLVR